MASFLAIESATDVCSVALLKNDHVVIEMALGTPRAHSENLVPMIQEALEYGEIKVQDLSGIVVSKGPGSYTGLRIGVSTAKGLAFSHKLDLIGVSSLEGLATGAMVHASEGDAILVAFNSRRNEVYLGLFIVSADNSLKPLGQIASLREDEIAPFISQHLSGESGEPEKYSEKLFIAGEGALFVEKCLSQHTIPGKPLVLPGNLLRPSAGMIATLGAARHKNGLIDALDSFEPFYLNEFIPKSRKKTIFDRLPF